MRVAYVTPYFKEEPQVLERCIKSVDKTRDNDGP